MTNHVINLPLKVQITKKKIRYFRINLNEYRNTHFQSLNKAKEVFLEVVRPQVEKLPLLGKIAITFTLFPGSKIECDTSNICSIADKFFCDALVECGKIEDDNYKFILGVQYLFGEIDKANPRVEARIHIQEN